MQDCSQASFVQYSIRCFGAMPERMCNYLRNKPDTIPKSDQSIPFVVRWFGCYFCFSRWDANWRLRPLPNHKLSWKPLRSISRYGPRQPHTSSSLAIQPPECRPKDSGCGSSHLPQTHPSSANVYWCGHHSQPLCPRSAVYPQAVSACQANLSTFTATNVGHPT